MDIKIDEQKILKEVLEYDGDLHQQIKSKVTERLVNNCVDQIESKFITKRWNGDDEIWDRVLEAVGEKQTEIINKILSDFYDSYKYGNKDADFIKKLKALISGELPITRHKEIKKPEL